MKHAEPIDVEYEIIDDPSQRDMGLDAPRDAAAEALNFILELLGEKRKGRALIEAIIATGYARDANALRQHYYDNQATINRLAQQINTEKLINDLVRSIGSENRMNLLGSFVAGGLAGGLVQHYMNRQA